MDTESPVENPNFVLSGRVVLKIDNWFANQLSLEDHRFNELVGEIRSQLPPIATPQEICAAIRQREEITKETEPERLDNKEKLLTRYKSGDVPLLGEWFDANHPANVCQQNVLLLSALAATYGEIVKVAGFSYIGSQSGEERFHAVAVQETADGEYILDPTLKVPAYGDVTRLSKEDYIRRFQNARISRPVEIFVPKPISDV